MRESSFAAWVPGDIVKVKGRRGRFKLRARFTTMRGEDGWYAISRRSGRVHMVREADIR